mmetsp:Transcript_78722/g.115314  ORF Transcript_78722/g.115314 Transcript_78722/m.115314 type:complete len:200 (-) Transcript_78722:148-747(-)
MVLRRSSTAKGLSSPSHTRVQSIFESWSVSVARSSLPFTRYCIAAVACESVQVWSASAAWCCSATALVPQCCSWHCRSVALQRPCAPTACRATPLPHVVASVGPPPPIRQAASSITPAPAHRRAVEYDRCASSTHRFTDHLPAANHIAGPAVLSTRTPSILPPPRPNTMVPRRHAPSCPMISSAIPSAPISSSPPSASS